MLQINTNFKKYKVPLIAALAIINGIFLFQYLTFIPEYSSAEEISTANPATTPIYEWGKLEYMQQMTPNACTSVEIGTNKILLDSRDGVSYEIKKLSDGRCWMINNLRIVGKIARSDDSDVISDYVIPDSSSSWSNAGPETNKVHYSGNAIHGAHYTYFAVTAGTAPAGGGEAEYSICPKGWKIPSDNEFKTLLANGSSGRTWNDGVSGYWIGGNSSTAVGAAFFSETSSTDDSGLASIGGQYWSATTNTSSDALKLSFGNISIVPSSSSPRYYGHSVRCVSRTTLSAPTEPGVDSPNVAVTVDKILTMELSNKEINIEPKNGEIMTGDFTATVSSNSDYTLSITAAEGASTSLVNQNDNIVIAEIPTITNDTSTLTPNENNWAIRLCNDTNKTNCNNYKPITPYGTTNIFLANGTPTPSTTSLFEVGIGISPSLPSGTYSTNILITASQR